MYKSRLLVIKYEEDRSPHLNHQVGLEKHSLSGVWLSAVGIGPFCGILSESLFTTFLWPHNPQASHSVSLWFWNNQLIPSRPLQAHTGSSCQGALNQLFPACLCQAFYEHLFQNGTVPASRNSRRKIPVMVLVAAGAGSASRQWVMMVKRGNSIWKHTDTHKLAHTPLFPQRRTGQAGGR